MPTNCWNADSRMPTHTMGSRPKRGPRRSPMLNAWPASMVLLDGEDLGALVRREHRLEHRPGLVEASLLYEVSRRLGDAQRHEEVDAGGDEHDEEHPAPGLDAEQPVGRRAAGGLDDEVVGDAGGEDAEDDRELLQGAEAAAQLRRGDLRDVHGRDDARHADPGTADQAPQHEHLDVGREGRADCTGDEEQGRDQHHLASSEVVPRAARRTRLRRPSRSARSRRRRPSVRSPGRRYPRWPCWPR